MSDSMEQDMRPRRLLRWAEGEEMQGPGNENTNEGSAEEDEAQSGSEAMVPPKREDWYGSKMKRLKDNVEKLRQEIRDKERDYVRLKNKYNVMKRKQEQLEEDLKRHSEVKLDSESEVELLRLQLIEKEKEITSQRSKTDDASSSHEAERGGKTTPELNCGIETSDVETSLESCLALGDSFLARKYLMFHKEGRRWLVYGILAAACVVSLVTSLGMSSSLMSSIAVGMWTLGLFFLAQERKERFRALRLKHMKKIRELSVEKTQVVEEKRKLEIRKVELEKEVSEELEDKAVMKSTLTTLSDKFDEATTKNEELAKLEKSTLEELQSERVRRRRTEEELEEVSARAAVAREEHEVLKGGEVCRKLRESLSSEKEENVKLGRENQRLIEEIVAMNMKEEKKKMEREKKEMEDQVDHHGKERKRKENIDIRETEDTEEIDGEIKSEPETKEETESKTPRTAKLETIGEVVQAQEIKSSTERSSQTIPKEMDVVNVPNGGLILPSPPPPGKPCLLCSWKIPTEVQVALCVGFLACFILQLHFIFSSKIYIFACLLFMAVTIGFYRASCSMDTN